MDKVLVFYTRTALDYWSSYIKTYINIHKHTKDYIYFDRQNNTIKTDKFTIYFITGHERQKFLVGRRNIHIFDSAEVKLENDFIKYMKEILKGE